MSHVPEDAADLIAKGEFEAAEVILEAALRAEPDAIPLRIAYADSLAMQLQFDRAIEHSLSLLHHPELGLQDRLFTLERMARCATQVNVPSLIRPYLSRIPLNASPYAAERCWPPRLLRQAGYADEARAGFEAILREFPGDVFTSYFLGETLMELGDTAGIALSAHFMSRDFARIYAPAAPAIERIWDGEPLENKSIVIVPWGGHGDMFQFAGHIAQLKRLGAARVTAIANAPYRRLLESAGVDQMLGVAEFETAIAGSDYWTSSFGLVRAELHGGGARKTSGYMTPPPSQSADTLAREIRARAAGRPSIGLYWYSDQAQGDVKSVPLPRLAPLFAREDVHWVILQRGFGLRRMLEARLGATATVPVRELPFDDAGALFTRLDGVVSICAWPFHLAGAVGTRTWLLAGRVMSARHLNSERQSFLYPDCATIVRQPAMGDWAGAIARLNADLDEFVAGFRPGS